MLLADAPALTFLAGLMAVVLGAELLLRGATRVATRLGVSPVVIGLTVVSVGTSTPELAVGIAASAEGRGTLAVGNIAGTNILNILFILGLSALLRPLPVGLESVKLDVPAMIASALVLLAMSLDGVLSRAEGALLLLGAMAYTAALVRSARRERTPIRREFEREFGAGRKATASVGASLVWSGIALVVGITLAVVGAELLVAGAVEFAREHQVSDAFIGLTIVAIGTSAPELVTTVLATLHDDRDVAIGNLVGSSTYNILAILGLTMLVSPTPIEVGRDVLWIDLPLAALVAAVCLPVFRSGQGVSRAEGGAFVLAYFAYMALLVLFRT